MKVNRRNYPLFVILFIFLIIPLTFSLSMQKDSFIIARQEYKKESTISYTISPKISDYWNESDVPFIHIYNDNWSAVDLAWIQNRTGTWNDPHIIENITINAGKSGNGIIIEDSDEYFIIRNCTIYNSSIGNFDKAAIYLKNANNGTIANNKLSFNNGSGIILENSINNTISANNVSYNKAYGIYSIGISKNNTILNNNIDNNTIIGVFFNYTTLWNKIYNNNITRNGMNAMDNGTENRWYLGTTGNFWDDYIGCDSNGDNRGETPYNIPGNVSALDIYPICYKRCASTPRTAKPAVEEDEVLKEAYATANIFFENFKENIGVIALGLIIIEIIIGLLIFTNRRRNYRLLDEIIKKEELN